MPISNLMPESASRVERKRIRNRDAFVAAARNLFVSKGFDSTTIADIAEAADLGFGTFYRYFPDKEAVLEAVFDDGKNELDAALQSVEPAGTPPAVALTRLSQRFARLIHRDRDLLGLMWQVAMSKSVGRRPLSFERPGPDQALPVVLARAIQPMIEQGMARGDFAQGDAAILARLIAGAHMSLLIPGALDVDEDAVTATLCAFELRALSSDEHAASLIPDPEQHTARRRAVGRH
jgi:AcrR family transcriptional regulator